MFLCHLLCILWTNWHMLSGIFCCSGWPQGISIVGQFCNNPFPGLLDFVNCRPQTNHILESHENLDVPKGSVFVMHYHHLKMCPWYETSVFDIQLPNSQECHHCEQAIRINDNQANKVTHSMSIKSRKFPFADSTLFPLPWTKLLTTDIIKVYPKCNV